MTSQNVIEDLFVFAIPLVPSSRAANWQRVLDNLQATLQSILNQRDQNFHCLLAVEDPIPLPEVANPKITLVTLEESHRLNFPRDNYVRANEDAGRKRSLLSSHAAAMRAKYIMFADADDLVSNRLVEITRAHKPEYGAAVRHGFVLDSETGKCLPVPSTHVRVESFDTYCGTSIITNMDHKAADGSNTILRLWNKGHNVIRAEALNKGTPLLDLNEPLCIYVLNSGENLSTLETNTPSMRTFAQHTVEKITRYGSPLTKAQLEEFGLWQG